MLISKRVRFRALLLLLAVANASLAEDGFITQPRMRKASQPGTTQSASKETPPSIRQSLQGPTSAANTNGHPIVHANTASVPSFAGPAASQLHWVSRKRATRAQHSAEYESPQSTSVNSYQVSPATTQPVVIPNPAYQPNAQLPPPSQGVVSEQSETTKKQAEEAERKMQLASLISSEILSQQPKQRVQLNSHVDSTPGWEAVKARLMHHLDSGHSLLRRGAFLSARDESEQAILHLLRVLDQASNDFLSEPVWNAAQTALRESEDFSSPLHVGNDGALIQRLVDSHQTEVLKRYDMTQISPLVAAEHYRQYSYRLLVEAAQGHPWMSDAYFALGRTYQAQADKTSEGADALRWRAVTFYQAALSIQPKNSIAANQLGFILLQMDRPADAQQAIAAALQHSPAGNIPALKNMVEASRRLGDTETQQWALQQYSLAMSRRAPAPSTPQVQLLSVEQFKYISPEGRPAAPSQPDYSVAAANSNLNR